MAPIGCLCFSILHCAQHFAVVARLNNGTNWLLVLPGDHIDIHSNDSESSARPLTQTWSSMDCWRARHPAAGKLMIVVAAWLHDVAPTHKGQVTQKEKWHVYSHFDEKRSQWSSRLGREACGSKKSTSRTAGVDVTPP